MAGKSTIGRFGSGREVRRIEDAALLAGAGCPAPTWSRPGCNRCRSRQSSSARNGSPAATPPRPALAHETVRFVGEAVAALVAETREQAKDALDAIEVEYEELPVVTDMTQATGNIVAQMRLRRLLGGLCQRTNLTSDAACRCTETP